MVCVDNLLICELIFMHQMPATEAICVSVLCSETKPLCPSPLEDAAFLKLAGRMPFGLQAITCLGNIAQAPLVC